MHHLRGRQSSEQRSPGGWLGRSLAIAFALLVGADGVVGQIQVRAVVARELKAWRHRVVVGTVVAPGGEMGGTTTCSYGFAFAIENISYDLTQPAPDTFDARFTMGVLSMNGGSTCGLFSAEAEGALRLEITAAVPVSGTLVFDALTAGSNGEVDIDMHADGQREVNTRSGSQFYSAPVTLDSTPTLVVIGAECSATNHSSRVDHRVRFIPGVPIGRDGAGCGARLGLFVGPQATDGTRMLEVQHETNQTLDAAFLVFGTQQQFVPIPPTMCPLRTDILIPLPLPRPFEYQTGRQELRLPMPSGLDVRIQFLAGAVINGEEFWTTSAALRLRMP